MERTKVIIMGAAGRDFHDFNVCYRNDPSRQVVAFTAAQIPDIDNRIYPPELAGALYPGGIPICPESDLADLICQHQVDQVVFAYSDVSHVYVMNRASLVIANGAEFVLLGARDAMLTARKPVVAVCAVRTGAGKSQTTRRVASILRQMGLRPVVVRHPMPYGNLIEQAVQRFGEMADLDRYHCTIEEREEYEPHIAQGTVVYAGVDYERVLSQAESEADVLVWDGGNNDLPFFKPTIHIVLVDPHRPGHELLYHPGEANLRMADVIVINKVDTARADNVTLVRQNAHNANPRAIIVEAASPIYPDDPAAILDKRVLVVEDGPTLTHGDMAYGAGIVAAKRFGAKAIVDPRAYAVGSIVETYRKYPNTGALLPAMGYSDKQIAELAQTIAATPCDLVIIATPVDLRRLISIEKPTVRVRYELEERTQPDLEVILRQGLTAGQGRQSTGGEI
jgi:predicted GTPase